MSMWFGGLSFWDRAVLGRGDVVKGIIAKYGAAAIYIPDFNPNRAAASGLSRLYTTAAGVTAAVSAADTLGLVLDESQGAALGADLVTNGGFGADANWTKGTGWSIGSGVASFTATGSTANLSQNLGLVAEAIYEITLTVTVSAGTLSIFAGVSGSDAFLAVTASGTYTSRQRAAGDAVLYLQAGATFTGTVDNVSVRRISGNHLRQATSASRGTLRQVGSRWVWRGDGSDDNLLSTLAPAASTTLIVACEFNSANDIVTGARSGASDRAAIVSTSGRQVGAQVGSQDQSTIRGGAEIQDVPVVAVLRFNGSLVSLFSKPFTGSFSKVYEAAQVGSPTTAIPLRLGAGNNNGTAEAGAFFDGDIYAALAIQAALTDAEIAAVANQFSR